MTRVAIVTGGAQGIGSAIAARLIAVGYRVIVADADAEAGREAERASTWASPLLLGSFVPFLYWSTSGMEGTFVAAVGLALTFGVGRLIDAERSPRPGELVALAAAALAFALAFRWMFRRQQRLLTRPTRPSSPTGNV